jgi:hypothetical protein
MTPSRVLAKHCRTDPPDPCPKEFYAAPETFHSFNMLKLILLVIKHCICDEDESQQTKHFYAPGLVLVYIGISSNIVDATSLPPDMLTVDVYGMDTFTVRGHESNRSKKSSTVEAQSL